MGVPRPAGRLLRFIHLTIFFPVDETPITKSHILSFMKFQGIPQHIQVTFESPATVNSISLTFQGGFVGKKCALYGRRQVRDDTLKDIATGVHSANADASWSLLERIYPEDVNRKQTFTLSSAIVTTSEGPQDIRGYDQLKIVFEESTDFFGRIVVYALSIEGKSVP
jgi:hypothetical protein